MTRLNVGYQGFKLGVRIADSLALALNVAKKEDVDVLHKMKNMAHVIETMRSFKAFSVNGVTYAE